MNEAAFLGAAIGLAVGVADYVAISRLMAAMRRDRPAGQAGPEAILKVAQVAQLVAFPVLGWFVGSVLFSSFRS